ncbi:hypothetical protein SUGI_0625850 [Cryptomeria japonica]|nr:hypothetical protein SUGI_0625850 [Cryptomeria japonica]
MWFLACQHIFLRFIYQWSRILLMRCVNCKRLLKIPHARKEEKKGEEGVQGGGEGTNLSILTWAGSIGGQEGRWPRESTFIAHREGGSVYHLPLWRMNVIICDRGGSRSRGPHTTLVLN